MKFDQRIVIMNSIFATAWVVFAAYSVIHHAWMFVLIGLAMIAFNAYSAIPSLQALVSGEE